MSLDTQMRNEWAEYDGERIAALESRLAEAQAEAEKLKIIDKYRTSKTPWLISELQSLSAERDRYKQALEKIIKDWDCDYIPCQECGGTEIAKAALEGGETK